jgi:hypothetical protein
MSKCRNLLRIPDAVRYLDGTVTASTIRGWIFRKKITHVRLNGVTCIPRSELDALIRRGTVRADKNV